MLVPLWGGSALETPLCWGKESGAETYPPQLVCSRVEKRAGFLPFPHSLWWDRNSPPPINTVVLGGGEVGYKFLSTAAGEGEDESGIPSPLMIIVVLGGENLWVRNLNPPPELLLVVQEESCLTPPPI